MRAFAPIEDDVVVVVVVAVVDCTVSSHTDAVGVVAMWLGPRPEFGGACDIEV